MKYFAAVGTEIGVLALAVGFSMAVHNLEKRVTELERTCSAHPETPKPATPVRANDK